jgi:ATP-dependent Lon protease
MIQKYDINRVSLEQQIYVLNIPEYIKEKAMIKLKEIKGRTDESSSKAKQYLEGLLKIPFGVYKKEPILNNSQEINTDFIRMLQKMNDMTPEYMNLENALISNVENYKKDKYTNNEIMQYVNKNLDNITSRIKKNIISVIYHKKNKELIQIIEMIQDKNCKILKHTKKKENIQEIINYMNTSNNIEYLYDIYKIIFNNSVIDFFCNDLLSIKTKIKNVRNEITAVKNILDKSIHGHAYAKNQILKIIGQWMNGTQAGYCFGFEGSPGIGKTSLAKKGLANCLIDADGKSRPFAFIALGGSSNGSTLEGHSYTYVNSMWGRIVDILMETKCMNPIIYIDELDKVSKTEHGKEIIGILTHLIDSTQNDCFQDKYYSGINIDLSKALFIFSYNDPDNIDRILLDRIHRIHFDNLSMDEKKVIVKEYLLPEINEKMGFQDTVVIGENVIEFIIENYTMEPGIRKLKEIIFDLYGEINLELLNDLDNDSEIPIKIKIDDLESKYLKKYNKIQDVKINTKSAIGIINGLWANSLGKGGIIPIETMLYPCSSFLELRLTGLPGDVMKESMNVAKSLAWSLTPDQRKRVLLKEFEEMKCQGLHIHCPEGAVSKDGPSAGTAITCAIYSLFNKKKNKK